ncbi:hypothetical protein HYZ64_01725 [Candidatus Berkelbacteria bacterium]|nr:hypothetical protein [Candidatus Berkelbacteria bacterium]
MENQSKSQNSNYNLKIIIVALVLVILLVASIGIVSFYVFGNKTIPVNEKPNLGIKNGRNTAIQHTPVVIYTQQVKTTDSSSRSWPTVKILRKNGNAKPEILAEVGKVGEYPDKYQLSPDKKFLLINLESKLQILNLSTKELKDLFIPKRQILSTSYSPDGKLLFIWDQKYAPTDGDKSYYVHLFTISDQKDQILKQGTSDSSFFGTIWRADNKIVLNEPLGDFSRPSYFDLSSTQITKTPGDFASGLLSQSGNVMAVVKDEISDVCNYFSGSTASVYNIIDPVSGKILGTIDGSGNGVAMIAFSPDDNEALYVAQKPRTNQDDCNKKAESSYYKVQIVTGQSTKLANLYDILKSWNENYIGATVGYGDNKSVWSILIGDQTIITSNKELSIVAQFYN